MTLVRHGILHAELHHIPENNYILIFLPQGSVKSQTEFRKRETLFWRLIYSHDNTWFFFLVFFVLLSDSSSLFRVEIQSQLPWFYNQNVKYSSKKYFLSSLMYINHIWKECILLYFIWLENRQQNLGYPSYPKPDQFSTSHDNYWQSLESWWLYVSWFGGVHLLTNDHPC